MNKGMEGVNPDECAIRSEVSEGIRLELQESIISQYGVYFTCQTCHEKFHLLDLHESIQKLDDTPILRYICEKCKIIVVEARSE